MHENLPLIHTVPNKDEYRYRYLITIKKIYVNSYTFKNISDRNTQTIEYQLCLWPTTWVSHQLSQMHETRIKFIRFGSSYCVHLNPLLLTILSRTSLKANLYPLDQMRPDNGVDNQRSFAWRKMLGRDQIDLHTQHPVERNNRLRLHGPYIHGWVFIGKYLWWSYTSCVHLVCVPYQHHCSDSSISCLQKTRQMRRDKP